MLEKWVVKKVCHDKDQHSQSQFLRNLFLVMKKDLGYRAVLNLKAVLNRAFKPVRLGLMESWNMCWWRRLLLQNWSEGRLFYNTSRQHVSSFSEFSVERVSLLIHVSGFWNFQYQSPNITFAAFEYQILHKKWSLQLRNSWVNVTKSADSFRFGYIYLRNPWWETSFFCAVRILTYFVDMLWSYGPSTKNILSRLTDFYR